MSQAASRAARKWNPSHYLHYERVRGRPVLDLIAQIPLQAPETIVDLGCGSGNALGPILNHWSSVTSYTCLDTSKEMLDQARDEHKAQQFTERCHLKYELADFEQFAETAEPNSVDVIFSNAAIHWVSFQVHQELLPKLMTILKPGGVLAFQIPDSRAQPSHLLMRQVGRELEYKELEQVRWVTAEVEPSAYYNLLLPYCFNSDGDSSNVEKINMWSTKYSYVLQGSNPVLNYVSSTALGVYVNALGGPETVKAKTFVEEYGRRVEEAYPKVDIKNDITLFPMNRFFVVAQKKD